ncbi:hypothetical protein J7U46_10485 [Pelomonas sp. V22]|uniref:hypothetical protein n=1 Tax=Pelomonas sp. V22 TaxID=2822139 RepID=UPI0024A9C07F|nr:hypothetical protein [Pelomonas sp. V22]MDI4633476.1 hypothetical protein [Pelomonas sp. V22]
MGRKTGGRVAGTVNRKTADVIERLAQLGCDPIEGMAVLAMDACNPPELRGRMYAELAQYVAPKRRALDVGAATAPVVQIRLGIPMKAEEAPPVDAV